VQRRVFLLSTLAACMPRSPAARPSDEEREAPTPKPFAAPPALEDASASPSVPSKLDVDARVDALREQHAGQGYTIVAESPFAVIGDESAARVREHAEGTVRWATTHLREAYFRRDPEHVIDVWLFADEDSYRRGAKRIFGDEPDTPYGYYSRGHRALIMNIGSGGGTLVHEMVHPLMEANFPKCPSWFNEGLASLYEQCGEREGRIWGFTNWRLPGLQDAIQRKAVPAFADLLASGDDGFYDEDRGTNYAQARYLCYWLQERDKLVAFYRDFVAAAKSDPNGEETLRAHVGDDLVAVQRRWERWVLGLRFA